MYSLYTVWINYELWNFEVGGSQSRSLIILETMKPWVSHASLTMAEPRSWSQFLQVMCLDETCIVNEWYFNPWEMNPTQMGFLQLCCPQTAAILSLWFDLILKQSFYVNLSIFWNCQFFTPEKVEEEGVLEKVGHDAVVVHIHLGMSGSFRMYKFPGNHFWCALLGWLVHKLLDQVMAIKGYGYRKQFANYYRKGSYLTCNRGLDCH